MKRILISTRLLLAGVFTCQRQNVAVKTNALYWATSTSNIGRETAWRSGCQAARFGHAVNN